MATEMGLMDKHFQAISSLQGTGGNSSTWEGMPLGSPVVSTIDSVAM